MDENDRHITMFTTASHGLVHTYELSIPILMTAWLVDFSVTSAALGLAVTVGYGLFGIGALPSGILVDRFGSKPLIIICLLGMAAAFLIVSIAPNLSVLIVAIGLWGITASIYHPAGLALISKGVSNPGVAFGYHGVGGNLGIALGPLVTVLLLLQYDWRIVTAALVVPTIFVMGYGLFINFDATVGTTQRRKNNKSNPKNKGTTKGQLTVSTILNNSRVLFTLKFSLVFVIVMFSGLYYRAFLTFLPSLLNDLLSGIVEIQLIDSDNPYADEFDVSRYLYVGILIFGVMGQYIGGQLADRLAPERVLMYILGILAVLAMLFVPTIAVGLAPFLVVALLLGVTLFTIQPLQQATIAAYSTPDTRGLSFGYTFLAIFGVGALGAGLAGGVLTYANINVLFLLLSLLAAIGAILTFVLLYVD